MVPDNLSPDFIWDKNKDQLNQNFWDKRQLLLIFVIVKKSSIIHPAESSSRRFQVLQCFGRVPVKVSCCLPLPQLEGKRNSYSAICYKIILICCRHVCSKNHIVRDALQKNTTLFGNFSQTSDPPPHPPLLGTPYPKKNLVFILHFRT